MNRPEKERPLSRCVATWRTRLPSFGAAVVNGAAERSVLIAWVLFVLAGLAVLDDYGASLDEPMQRNIALVSMDYALGRSDALLSHYDRSHGVAFELFLLAIERLLRLEDSRHIFLSRHLASHLLFALGGWCCAQLALRLTGNRWLACCALCLFVLHPRLYAHSFFNSKDVPFLSLFMLALLLLHRAFRAETARAFLLAGAGVGVLTNIRLAGALLFGAVLLLRACDLVYAPTPAARRRILWTTGLFAATAALTLYATWPYLWGDPLERLGLSFRRLARWRLNPVTLFQGQFISAQNVPAHYVPTWFAITGPPNALLLGGLGVVALVRRSLRRPGAVLRNTRLRFQCLLLACCVLPLLSVIWLGSTLYNGWRHLYFLYAPFCLLAAIGGLHALVASARRLRRGGGEAYGLAGIGAAAMLGALISLHPYQHLYFNFWVDRATPERLLFQYDLDYWSLSFRNVLEFLLAHYPDEPIYVQSQFGRGHAHRHLLSATDRQRLALTARAKDFYIDNRRGDPWVATAVRSPPYAPAIHTQTAYGNTLALAAAVNLEKVDAATAAPYRATYRALTAREPVVRDHFNVYLDADAVSWIRDPCQPEDTEPRFLLYLAPVDPQDLPAGRRRFGFDNLNFNFVERGVRLDGACLAVVPRPTYPIRSLSVGQFPAGGGPALWQADIPVPPAVAYRAAYRTLAARPLTHRSAFNVYVTPTTVTFAKAPCTEADAQPRFVLHLAPVDPRVLPDRPFDNRDFSFDAHGARFDRACLATVPLPAYPIRQLTVGQWRGGNAQALWLAELSLPLAPRAVDAYRAAYRALTTGPPAHRAVFDVYVTADAVAYAKAPCTAEDTQPKFILHVIPARPRDLPPDHQNIGFENRGFQFAWQGAHFDGVCLARAPLPAYAIAYLRVGQFRAGETVLWSAEIPRAR